MVPRIFLGRYETIRLLGEGGMGRVYLARQLDLGRQVVVKVMHDHIAADEKFRERFQRETLVMARFQHPYVVTLYDASLNDPEGPCIVMEHIRGITLDTLLHRNGRLSPHRIARIVGQLCEALQAAHHAGIVHRDLKPANLMVVDPDTPYEKIKVMDFGLAKELDTRTKLAAGLSDTGQEFAVGTPGYISPEQVRGDGQDHRSDLYSVGVLLFEFLTGRLPFIGTETMDVLLSHATEHPPRFADVGLDGIISSAVERVVMCCLEKNPDDRPQSALELAEMYEIALFQDELHEQDLIPDTAPPDPTQMTPAPYQNYSQTDPPKPPSTPIPTQPRLPEEDDPNAVVKFVEAWMPEAIAAYKLRGFVDEVGGHIIENVPGTIRVRMGGKGATYSETKGAFAWLGLGKKKGGMIDMELRLDRKDPDKQSNLSITVIMKSTDPKATATPAWRDRCNRIFCDLRAHLMASGGGLGG
ncbi:MAG: serine/threonine protein kinase [Gemmataceae bacterium]